MDDHRKLSAAPPVQMEAVARVDQQLDDDDLSTIAAIACNYQSGRITKHEIAELIKVYRAYYASPVPSSERDDIIEMCAATVERHVRDLDARPDSWMAAWAKECAAHLRSLKSQPAQESGEGK